MDFKIMGIDFEIKYKPGKENNVAYALSRQMQYNTLTTVQCEAWEGLEDEVQNDAKLHGIVKGLIVDPFSHHGFK
ncbi:transposon Ty3 gag-pol polyprotein, partial [Trifolium pratense]